MASRRWIIGVGGDIPEGMCFAIVSGYLVFLLLVRGYLDADCQVMVGNQARSSRLWLRFATAKYALCHATKRGDGSKDSPRSEPVMPCTASTIEPQNSGRMGRARGERCVDGRRGVEEGVGD